MMFWQCNNCAEKPQKNLILSYVGVLKTLVIIVTRRLEKCSDFVRSLKASFFYCIIDIVIIHIKYERKIL